MGLDLICLNGSWSILVLSSNVPVNHHYNVMGYSARSCWLHWYRRFCLFTGDALRLGPCLDRSHRKIHWHHSGISSWRTERNETTIIKYISYCPHHLGVATLTHQLHAKCLLASAITRLFSPTAIHRWRQKLSGMFLSRWHHIKLVIIKNVTKTSFSGALPWQRCWQRILHKEEKKTHSNSELRFPPCLWNNSGSEVFLEAKSFI